MAPDAKWLPAAGGHTDAMKLQLEEEFRIFRGFFFSGLINCVNPVLMNVVGVSR